MKGELVFALENAGWPALLVDEAGTIRRANQAAVKVFGPAVEGETTLLSAIWVSENKAGAEQFLAAWERTPTMAVPLKFRTKGGATASFLVSICAFSRGEQRYFVLQLLPDTVAAALVNSTCADPQSQGVEASVVQKQKLDCALQLARTVALDFNNALTSILGNVSWVLGQMEPNHPWRRALMEVEKAAGRAAEIAGDLAAFSRQEKDNRATSNGNLNALLQRCVDLFRATAPSKITWTLQLEPRLFAAKFDEAKLQQAFFKIFENAVEALGQEGRICIHTRNLELTTPTQDRHVRLAKGNYVCVEITDNGCGIAPDILSRVFEPFFTTKSGGKHRGLGLAWVYGIVTNHGGGVAVSSQPGMGTSVRVYLPATHKILGEHLTELSQLRGNQTVLVVDDEELLLTMAHTVLSSFGYHVLTATSGSQALERLAQSDRPVDLVLTDLVMPNMSGTELVEQIRQRCPQTRVICTSGFVQPSNALDDTTFLQKPFSSRDLLLKVKRALTTG